MIKIEKPEIIQQKIEKLKIELNQSQLHYNFQKIQVDNTEIEGFYNIGLLRRILYLLNNGARLQIRHDYFGVADVYMNPQRNRIIVDNNSHFTDNNIVNYMMRSNVGWFINTKYTSI